MTPRKRQLGQFFTKRGSWLKPQIIDFICSSKASIAVDPFAGAGDLLEAAKSIGIVEGVGFDIDQRLGWKKKRQLSDHPQDQEGDTHYQSSILDQLQRKKKTSPQKGVEIF